MPFERENIGLKFQRLTNFVRGRLPTVVNKHVSSIKLYANPLENITKSRAYRYLYLEAGAAAQSAMLTCVALEPSSVFMPAFYDDELAKLLNIDNHNEIALAAIAIAR